MHNEADHAQSRDAVNLEARPRRLLSRRIIRTMAALAILQPVLCVLLFNGWLKNHLIEQRRNDGNLLGHVLAASLAGRISTTGWSRTHGELLDSLSKDSRVAFVCVTDPKGEILHVGVFDSRAWSQFAATQEQHLINRRIDISMPIAVDLGNNLLVRTNDIINPPPAFSVSADRDKNARIEGVVVLGFRDMSLSAAARGYEAAQAIIAVFMCGVCLPLITWLMRGWSRRLQELIRAIRRLAEGKPPEPVSVGAQDEVGYMALAFNEMAGRLVASHQALTDTNRTLEQRVRERTRELQEVVHQLDVAASTDALTGLANRRAFENALQMHFNTSVTQDSHLTCVMIDLDGFKQINDTLGHKAGDELLAIGARCLKQQTRSSDVVGRLGGDEFVILLPYTDTAGACPVADAVREAFCGEVAAMLMREQSKLRVTMSMGLASRKVTRPARGEDLVHQADQALYHAKETGKARLEIYHGSKAA